MAEAYNAETYEHRLWFFLRWLKYIANVPLAMFHNSFSKTVYFNSFCMKSCSTS